MKTFKLPYGTSFQTLEVEDSHFAGSLISRIEDFVPDKNVSDLVKEALIHPIGTKRLSELAVGKKNVVIISSDHTRPVPSRIMMPLLLEEIRQRNPSVDITILIATGLHRESSLDELVTKFGEDIVRTEKIHIHDCDRDSMVDLGQLPSGGPLVLNKIAVEADLLVAEGFIEPHFFAGFSGGRKSILPGVAGRKTVMFNHNAGFIDSPYARTGNLEKNPLHEDMIYAAQKAGLDFILNVVIDYAHNPVFAVAGDYNRAHLEGVKFLKKYSCVCTEETDIVVSTNGGYPLDQNVYQAVKGMTAAEAAVKKGGVIIMLAKSEDGHGGESFYKTFQEEGSIEKLIEKIRKRKPEDTIVDQWQSQILARVLLKATVIFVSALDSGLIHDLHMIPAGNVQEALEIAEKMIHKEHYQVTVIPDGVAVIVEPKR